MKSKGKAATRLRGLHNLYILMNGVAKRALQLRTSFLLQINIKMIVKSILNYTKFYRVIICWLFSFNNWLNCFGRFENFEVVLQWNALIAVSSLAYANVDIDTFSWVNGFGNAPFAANKRVAYKGSPRKVSIGQIFCHSVIAIRVRSDSDQVHMPDDRI